MRNLKVSLFDIIYIAVNVNTQPIVCYFASLICSRHTALYKYVWFDRMIDRLKLDQRSS